MRQKSNSNDLSSEEIVKGIRRATRKRHSAEEKIRIVHASVLVARIVLRADVPKTAVLWNEIPANQCSHGYRRSRLRK
jgi:hypothetical protein